MGPSWRARRAVVAWILTVLAVPAAARAGVGDWDALELPGPAGGLSRAVGIDPATPRARLLLELARAVHAVPPGASAEADLLRRRLQAWLVDPRGVPTDGTAASLVGNGLAPAASRIVPLPLPRTVWEGLLGLRAPDDAALAAALLTDRRASLLYVGAMGADVSTRAFLASHARLLREIFRDHAAAFAVFGRSLRVEGGRMALPGDASDVAVWEEVVGESVGDPESFILAALHRYSGRLAFFLDTVAHLDEARARFALAHGEADPGERLSRVRALVRLFTELHTEWSIPERPFARPTLDASLVLLSLRVTADGRLASPGTRAFWETVFEPRPRTARPPAARLGGEAADAAWLCERIVGVDVATGRERLGALSFVQRLFGASPRPEWPDVVRVARGFIDARTIVVALERLGAREARVFARAVDRARALSASADPGVAAASLAQVQSVLVVLERLAARGALTAGATLDLAVQLMDLPRDDAGAYRGAVAEWFASVLVPALGRETPDAEQAVLEALAGRASAGAAPSAPVTWDGNAYLVDVAGAELARLERVRDRQLGNQLGEALATARQAALLANAGLVAEVATGCPALTRLAAPLEAVSWPAPGVGSSTVAPSQAVLAACERLLDVRKDRELAKGPAVRARAELGALADAVFADALVAVAYALHVGEPAGAIDLAPDLARRHRFGLDDRDPARRARNPWALPEERLGGGQPWHVVGSLLGLEHGLGKLALRFLFGEEMPSPPRVNDNERRTLALGLALLNPSALQDADRDAIVAALARGRARLASPEGVSANLEAIAAVAGWSEWRLATVGWAAARDPDSLPSLLTLSDYFWVGRSQGDGIARLDAWGAATTPLDGDLRLAWPIARPWEELAGRAANGQLATRFVDMTLRVAETLAQLQLPASLVAGALAPALADLIHEAPLGHADDWYALAGYALRLPEDRMLDYIAALAAGGPLVPADDSQGPYRPGL